MIESHLAEQCGCSLVLNARHATARPSAEGVAHLAQEMFVVFLVRLRTNQPHNGPRGAENDDTPKDVAESNCTELEPQPKNSERNGFMSDGLQRV